MKISVVIPVYNAEKYLERCLDSVLNQSYKDFELILIDDGSTDKSGALCDAFATQDYRIRVLHQTNAGAGVARNVGLEMANGDYVVFVDSDDMIRQGYFEELARHNEDVVFINVDNIDKDGKLVKREYMSEFKSLPIDDILRSQMTGKIPWGGVRKCVKNSLIIENRISYSSHKIGEEAIYSYQVIRYARSVGFIEHPVYCYMLHDDSLSNTKIDDPWGEVAIALRQLVMNQGDYSIYADTLNAFIKTAAAVSLMKMAQNHPLLQYIGLARERMNRMQELEDLDYVTDWSHSMKKARMILGAANLHFWLLIWILSRLR